MSLLPAQWGTNVIPFKLEKRERWNSGEILPDNEVLCGVFGSSGEGKTLILCQLLGAICPKLLKYVIICSRIEGNPVYDAIESWCNKTDKEYSFCSDLDSSYDVIEDVINKKKDEEHFVIVMDDFNEGCVTSRTNPYARMTNEVFTKLRNYGGNMIFLVQLYTGLSTVARTNLNMIISFKMNDKYARQSLAKDFSTLINRDDKGEEIFKKLHSEIAKIKHSYIVATSKSIWIYLHNKMTEVQEVHIEGDSDSESEDD